MIIVFSNNNDQSTTEVLRWLKYFNYSFLRINVEDEIKLLQCDLHSFKFLHLNKTYNSADFTACWHRRGNFNIPVEITSNDPIPKEVQFKFFQTEQLTLMYFLHYLIEKIPSLNSFSKSSVNKLRVLEKAQTIGLEIPETNITSLVKDYRARANKHIFKAISSNALIKDSSKKSYNLYTNSLANIDFDKEYKFPLYIQGKIEKIFEIRTFYLDGQFFSMAIFSQQNEKTQIDFRKYDFDKPNRRVPHKLPKKVRKKISQLMKELKLNSGSIDLIYDVNDRYVFLEVNPVGQFGMVSIPTNSNIEMHIAKYLIKLSENKNYD